MSTDSNLAGAVYRHARTTPDALAITCQGRSLTYRELAERAAQLAAALTRADGGSRPDGGRPRVGILASRGVDACVALLGACWAGATYVPIGLKLPEERIREILRQCDLSALVTDDAGAGLLGEGLLAAAPPLVIHAGQRPVPTGSERIVELAALPPVAMGEPAAMAADDTAYIIFTSGTTGVPKGVMIRCGSARHYATTIARVLGLSPTDRALETCELGFDFSVHNMFATWEAGASLHVLPATMVMNAVKFVRNAGLTVWNSVPSLAGMLRQIRALAPDSLSGLRLTVFGGEQLPAGVVRAWRSAAPNSAIVNLYGPTEATVFCLAQAIEGDTLPLTPGRDIVAIGTPLPGNQACIIDDQGAPLPDGTPGELAVGGVQLAEGYLGAPALTAARFPTLDGQRWYRTGDLALRDASGTFHCLGRIDNQVKVMGYRVELEEIDAHLRVASGVDLVGSVAWPLDGGVARGIVSFVGAPTPDPDALISALKARVPAYMVPGRIIACPDMPLNASGKVDRRALLRQLEKGAA